MKSLDFLLRMLLPVVGVICILIPRQVTGALPFLLGGTMLLIGAARALLYLRSRAYLRTSGPNFGQSLILTVMGVAYLCKGPDAIGLMGITWGLLGLRKAAETFNAFLRQLYRREKFLLLGLDGVCRVVLALALLFDPFEKFSFHVVLLGLELILVNIRLPKELPPEPEEETHTPSAR